MAPQSYPLKNGKPTRKRGIVEVDDLEPLPRATRGRFALQPTADPGDRANQPTIQAYPRLVLTFIFRPFNLIQLMITTEYFICSINIGFSQSSAPPETGERC